MTEKLGSGWDRTRIDFVPQFKPGDPPPAGYVAWHEWAQVQAKAGLLQTRCPKCGLWRFPQELEGCCKSGEGRGTRDEGRDGLSCSPLAPRPSPLLEPLPVYSIALAFAGEPLCETRGLVGLMLTMPQLEPGLYMVHEAGHIVADATRHRGGWWRVEFYSGVRLSPGCIVV